MSVKYIVLNDADGDPLPTRDVDLDGTGFHDFEHRQFREVSQQLLHVEGPSLACHIVELDVAHQLLDEFIERIQLTGHRKHTRAMLSIIGALQQLQVEQ